MAQPTNQSPVKRQFLFNPLKRPMPYIGLILAFLIILFQGTIRQYTANVVGGWLVSNLKSSTQGNYTLNYDYVRFDIFTRELRMKNFELELDTTVTTPDKYLQDYSNLIEISTPVVVLKIESLWDILVNDKLRIAYIGLEKPRVDLVRSANLTEEKTQQNRQQATEQLRSYLEEVEIDSFRIVNGSVRIDLLNEDREGIIDYSVADFSTVLKGFQLSNIDPAKPFQGIYVEKVQLEVKDQEIRLPKLNHDVKFERLWISSKDSIIQIDSILFKPISQDSSGFKSNVSLNQLTLSALDFKKVYDDFSLDMGALKLDELNIELSDIIQEVDKANKSNLLSTLPFKSYAVDTFKITNSAVNLSLNEQIDIEKINLEIRDFKVDSANLSAQKIVDQIEDFSVGLENVHAELPDSIHEARVYRVAISSRSKDIRMNGIRINPIDNRRQYSLYKQQGANLISYANIRRLELNGIRFKELLSNHQLYADSLQVISPSANITQYPYINRNTSSKQGAFPYLIENIIVSNGRLNFNRRQNARNNRTELAGIDIEVKGFYPENQSSPTFDQLHLFVTEGSTELNNIQHTLRFNNLSSTDLRRFDINRLRILPDSNLVNKSTFDVSATRFSLVGYTRGFLADLRSVELEEVSAQTIKADLNILKDSVVEENSNSDLKQLVINRFYFNDADLKFKNQDIELEYNNLSSFVDSLHYSVYDTASAIPIRFKDLQLSHADFRVASLGEVQFEINGELGKFSENDSLISFTNLQYAIDDRLDGSLENIEVKGFEREKYLKNRELEFKYAVLDRHKMEIFANKRNRDSSSKTIDNRVIRDILLANFNRVDFDSLLYRNGNITLEGEKRKTNFNNSNIRLVNYEFDSTTAIKDVLTPQEFAINIAEVESIGQIDSVRVSGVSLDFVNNNLLTGKLDVSAEIKPGVNLTTTSPGLTINGLQLSRLIQQDFSVDTILLNNTIIAYYTQDSLSNTIDIADESDEVNATFRNLFSKNKDLSYDSLLRSKLGMIHFENLELDSNNNINFAKIFEEMKPMEGQQAADSIVTLDSEDSLAVDTVVHMAATNGKVGYFSMANSTFSWFNNNKAHEMLGEIKFSLNLDQVSLDTLNAFNIYDHIHDIDLTLRDYSFILPDSLNKIAFHRLHFSSKDESININNFQFIPLVDKYDYANKVGRQAGWHHLDSLDIDLSHLDLHQLIKDNVVHLKALKTSGGVLDIFKDKELPVPEDQYRPMLQDAIKSVKTPFIVDSLEIEDFKVHFTSRLASDMPEGSLSFYALTGKSGNITNIDTLLFKHSKLKLAASTKIMNDGLLMANFSFNMIDPENKFSFDAHLNPMSATDFNSLLEATAYVKIESGDIRDIKLAASGDNNYATGKMTFQYNDLKVSTINKRNLKTTGMGKVIKTFFANAFVVKKNNPAVKFFPRVGDMFFERDTQKIIIDYVAKTAMSGVVSSIGARNFRKEIRQIKKESRKQIDDEKNTQRKASKASTP